MKNIPEGNCRLRNKHSCAEAGEGSLQPILLAGNQKRNGNGKTGRGQNKRIHNYLYRTVLQKY